MNEYEFDTGTMWPAKVFTMLRLDLLTQQMPRYVHRTSRISTKLSNRFTETRFTMKYWWFQTATITPIHVGQISRTLLQTRSYSDSAWEYFMHYI